MLRKIFRLIGMSTLKLSPGEIVGLKSCLRLSIDNRALVIGVLVTGITIALLEGGTIGILILAINMLVSNETISFAKYLGEFGTDIDRFFYRFDKGVIFVLLVLVAVVAQLVKSGIFYLSQWTSVQLGTQVAKQLQEQITRRIVTLSYSDIGRYASGTVLQILGFGSSVAQIIVGKLLCSSVLSLFLLTVYLVSMLAISVSLTLIAIAVAAILSFFLTRISTKLRILGSKLVGSTLEKSRVTVEYLNAPRLIRIFDGGVQVEKHINQVRSRMLTDHLENEKIKIAIGPAIDAVTIFGIGLFLVAGFVIAGELAVEVLPSLLVFLLILNRMMPQVKSLNSYRLVFANVRKKMDTLGMFLQKDGKNFVREGGKPFNEFRREIHIRNVSFTYPYATKEALKEIDFCIEKGQMIALVGRSGAGKSTILDLMLGLHYPTKGGIIVDGINLQEINSSAWLRNIGVVDQEVFLINGTVSDNICFARDQTNQGEIEKAARAAHAHEFICELEKGYDTIIGDRGYRLSGGEQQRLALARALLTNPEILILDEATSSLDSESEALIQETLRKLHRSRTILIVAHRLSTVANADQIVVLEQGRIVEQGTRTELLRSDGPFSNWWELQSFGDAA